MEQLYRIFDKVGGYSNSYYEHAEIIQESLDFLEEILWDSIGYELRQAANKILKNETIKTDL